MKLFRFAAAAFALSLALQCPLNASNPFQISDELDKKLVDGLHHLYNLDFDEATATFNEVKSQAPEHPMVAFAFASMHWWRLSVYVLDTDAEESKPFLAAADECIKLSKEKISKGDKTGEGYLTLGGAMGLLGRWEATNQNWVSGYFTGKKAIKMLRKSLKINPAMDDAYMGLGIFDYYVATLPRMVRVLGFLGANNDPKVGLEELNRAAYHSSYSKTASKLFLQELYANQQNNPVRSWEIIDDLDKEFPTSPFLHILKVFAYYNQNQPDKLLELAKDFHGRIEKKVYREEFWPQAHFAMGLYNFKQKNWKEAIGDFDLAVKNGTTKNPFTTWSTLYKGYCLDILHDRKGAEVQYQTVLKQLRRWSSHDEAKKRLNKPFTDADDIFRKLKL